MVKFIEERYVISALCKKGVRQKEIAKELGVSPATICRELKRNRGKRGGYNAQTAHSLANGRKDCYLFKRKFTDQVEKRVRDYLENEQWSPEQIAGYCIGQSRMTTYARQGMPL